MELVQPGEPGGPAVIHVQPRELNMQDLALANCGPIDKELAFQQALLDQYGIKQWYGAGVKKGLLPEDSGCGKCEVEKSNGLYSQETPCADCVRRNFRKAEQYSSMCSMVRWGQITSTGVKGLGMFLPGFHLMDGLLRIT